MKLKLAIYLNLVKNTSYLMRVYIKKPLLIEFMPDGYIRYNISLNRNMF